MKYKEEEILNLPNIISAYRLFSFPFILTLVFLGKEDFYFWMLVFNLFTDVLDGFIARRFNLRTRFGARLDSLADAGTYILAALGLLWFRWNIVLEYRFVFILIFGFYLLKHLVSLLKFGKFGGLHLNLVRYNFLLQAPLFVILFKGGPLEIMLYITAVTSVIAYTEEILCYLILKEHRATVRSIFHLLKEKKHATGTD